MENLKKHQGDFMVACNNLVDDEGELIFAPGGTAPIYADDTYETELFRIAIVGMATPETQTKANPALMKGLSFIGGKDLRSPRRMWTWPAARGMPISSSLWATWAWISPPSPTAPIM